MRSFYGAKMKDLSPNILKVALMIGGMVASTVIFAFTTFESKGDAERKYHDQAKNLNDVNQHMSSLHQDLQESIKQIDAKLDILIQCRGH